MLREDRKKIEEKQKRKSGKSETGISRSGNARSVFLLGAAGTAVDEKFHRFFHNRWMDEVKTVEFKEFQRRSLLFSVHYSDAVRWFSSELLVLGTVGDEYEWLASWNVQVHEAAGQGDDMRNDFAVG